MASPPHPDHPAPLRRGWTTGACAAAAARAAYAALVDGRFPDPVTIVLPRDAQASFALAATARGAGWASATVVKDAGDDPDVTHGAAVVAHVALAAPGSGVAFRAGAGVGTVTLPGLALAVGEPAINPAPRQYIRENLDAVAGGAADAVVTVSIPDGQALAAKTMNARLGILGGLSILGTTGVVIPYSCAAWVHSIHRGVDVARALGLAHVGAATGKTSEAALRRLYALPEPGLIDMGDFAGGLLKYLRDHPVPRLTLAGGFAKLAKLAAGHMDLHSSRSAVDAAALAATLATLGAPAETLAAARSAHSAAQVLALSNGYALADSVARQARAAVLAVLSGGTEVDVLVVGRDGRVVGRAG